MEVIILKAGATASIDSVDLLLRQTVPPILSLNELTETNMQLKCHIT